MNNSDYIVLQKYGEYTVLKRNTNTQPFIVANNLHEDMTWDFGHYFNDLFAAVDFARSKGRDVISYQRMQEITEHLKRGIIEDDRESAYEYFRDTIKLTEEEAASLGISGYEEEEPYTYTF